MQGDWTVEYQSQMTYIISPDGTVGDIWSRTRLDIDHDRANARRIVACVNALAGVPIEDLEALTEESCAEIIETMGQISKFYKEREEYRKFKAENPDPVIKRIRYKCVPIEE